jgi:hypothetical protein
MTDNTTQTTPSNHSSTMLWCLVFMLLTMWIVTSSRADQAKQCYLDALQLSNNILKAGHHLPGSASGWNKRCSAITQWAFYE